MLKIKISVIWEIQSWTHFQLSSITFSGGLRRGKGVDWSDKPTSSVLCVKGSRIKVAYIQKWTLFRKTPKNTQTLYNGSPLNPGPNLPLSAFDSAHHGKSLNQPPLPATCGLPVFVKLRLPICEIWCEIFQSFRSLVYFILLSVQKFSYIDER